MKNESRPPLSRRTFLTNTMLSVGALTSASTLERAARLPAVPASIVRHSMPMPVNGVYTLSFSEPIDFAIPANLDGDSLTDWIGQHVFRKKTDIFRLEARSHHGNLLWKYDTGLDGHRMTHGLHTPVTAWDFDGDGIDEVITLRLGKTANPPIRAHLVMLDGKSGMEKAMIPIPWPGGAGNSRFNHGTTRCYATVAFLDGPRHAPSYVFHLGTYIDGCCWAFDFVDGQFRQRWAYQHAFHLGTGHHGLIAFDIDEDGRDEILMGGTILDADGCQVFSWSEKEGIGHADFVIPARMDPSLPGYQLLFGFEYGYGVALTSADGKVYWRNSDFYHAHSGWVAKVRDDVPGEQARCISKILSETWMHDGYPPDITHDIERTEAWSGMIDGKGSAIEIGNFKNRNRPPQWTGAELYNAWEVVENELGIQLSEFERVVPCDLGGGNDHGAEEIIAIKGNLLKVYFNQQATSYPSRWENLNYRKMAVSSIGSGYFFKDTYRTIDYPEQVHLPTPYVTVEGARNIGVRRQKHEAAGRLIHGQKYVLFRDAVHCFRGSTSWDSNGRDIDSYKWDFGDGTASTKADPLKRFEKNGTYSVSLTVCSGRRSSREIVEVEVQDAVLDYVAHVPHVLEVRSFGEGSRLYLDNEARAREVAEELKGMTLIRTHNGIERLRAGLLFSWDVTAIPFESIVFRTPIEMDVHVAMDEWAREKPAPDLYKYYNHPSPHSRRAHFWPEWLTHDGWQRTGLSVMNSLNDRRHVLYRKSYKPGEVVRIGPNRYQKSMIGDWDRNMYFVLLSEQPRVWMNRLFE